jgi:hypothetical protein
MFQLHLLRRGGSSHCWLGLRVLKVSMLLRLLRLLCLLRLLRLLSCWHLLLLLGATQRSYALLVLLLMPL